MLSLQEIQELEFQEYSIENWQKIIKAYEERYKNNPKDKETILRYMYVLFLLLLEDEVVKYPNFNYVKYNGIIRDLFFKSKDLFWNDSDYCFIVGYFLTFGVFETNDDYYGYYELGNSMIKRAYELQPDNIVYKLAYIGTLNNNKAYLEFKINNKEKINEALEKYFDNRGLMGDYFYMIYNCSEDTLERYKKFYIENTLEKYKNSF